MTSKTKRILLEAIFIYENAPKVEQQNLRNDILKNLKNHENGLKIGFGAVQDFVSAAIIFRRIYKF